MQSQRPIQVAASIAASTAFVLALAGGTCTRPPVDPIQDGGEVEGRHVVDFLAFAQDRPAVGGDWYLYQEDAGHLLEPFDHVYIVRDGADPDYTYAALRLVSYYDPDNAESGRFTVRTSTWDGTDWNGSSEPQVLSNNIKSDGPSCLDFFGATFEVGCDGAQWQVMLRAYPFLAREGPIVVTRPGLYVRSVTDSGTDGLTRIATLEGRTSLDALPNPTSIAVLDEAPPDGWGPISYDLGRFAQNLPTAGMTLGERYVDANFSRRDDVFFLVNAVRSMVRFQVSPMMDGAPSAGLRFTWGRSDVDLDDNTISEDTPSIAMTEVAVPPVGATTFLSFENEDLLMDATFLEGTQLPHLPPNERRWDLALVRISDATVRIVLSPGAAIANATAADASVDLQTAVPPQ